MEGRRPDDLDPRPSRQELTVKALAPRMKEEEEKAFFRAPRVCCAVSAVQGLGMRGPGVHTAGWGTGRALEV